MLPQRSILGRLRIVEVFHFYDGPRLFTCESASGSLYVVFWLGESDSTDDWLYVPVSATRLELVRAGDFSLQECVLRPEDGWLWRVATAPETGDLTSIDAIEPEELAPDDIPDPDSYLEGLGAAERERPPVPTELYASRANLDVVDFALTGEGRRRPTIGARTLSNAVGSLQSVVDAIALSQAGFRSRKGRVPHGIKENVQLEVAGAFPSSFGLRMEAAVPPDLFGEAPTTPVFKALLGLISAGSDEQRLADELAVLGGRVAGQYTALMTKLASVRAGFKLRWASPAVFESFSAPDVSWEKALQISDALLRTIEGVSEIYEIRARLDGIDVITKRFHLLNLETDERLRGHISEAYVPHARSEQARVPGTYNATIQELQEVHPLSGDVKEKYILLNLEEPAG